MRCPYVVIAKVISPDGSTYGTVHEYHETEEAAEAMFHECLRDVELLESEKVTIAWGMVAGEYRDEYEPENVDWYRWVETKEEIAAARL